ncbi:hypothetical protein HDU67_006096 [Dinochytrium kinnereticum]|nr:hypothetical protein HDU67_006096 [Dinochytrium kinnereticum]
MLTKNWSKLVQTLGSRLQPVAAPRRAFIASHAPLSTAQDLTASPSATLKPLHKVAPTKSSPNPIAELKRQLDLGGDVLSTWRLYRAIATGCLDASHLRSLSTADVNQLMAIAASGLVQRTTRAQREALEELFELMVKSQIGGSPDAESVSFILTARCRDGDVDGMIALLQFAKQRELKLEAQMVGLDVLTCYGKAGRFDEARYVLNRIISVNSPPVKKSLEEREIEAKEVKERRRAARQQYEDKIISEAGIPIETTAESSSKTDKAVKRVPSAADDAKIAPAVQFFLPTVAEMLRKPPLPADAPKALVQRRFEAKPRLKLGMIIRSFNVLLDAYARGGHRAECDALLEHMKEHGPKPNNESFSAAMMAARKFGDAERVASLETEASKTMGIHWSRVLNNHLLESVIATGDPYAAKKALDDLKSRSEANATRGMRGPDVYTLVSMVKVAGLAGDATAAWSAFAQLLQISGRQISPTVVAAYLALANGPLSSSGTDGNAAAEAWSARAVEAKLSPSASLYRLGMIGYATLGDLAAVEALSLAFDAEVEKKLRKIKARSGAKSITFAVQLENQKEGQNLVYHRALELLAMACSPASVRKLPAGIVPRGMPADLFTVPLAFFETMVSKRGIAPSERALKPLLNFLCHEASEENKEIREQLAKGLAVLMKEKGIRGDEDVLRNLSGAFGETAEVVVLYTSTLSRQ